MRKKGLLAIIISLLLTLIIVIGSDNNMSNTTTVSFANANFLNQTNNLLSTGQTYNLENYIISENSYIKINGKIVEDLSEVNPVNYGDAIEIYLAWNLPNSGLNLSTKDTFVFRLPDNLSFEDVEDGLVRNGADIVGTYTIKDHKITIQYTDEDFVKLSNINGNLTVQGVVSKSTTSGENGGRVDLNIPGIGTIPIYVNPQSSLSLNKDLEKINSNTYEFTVEVEAFGTNNSVVIADVMGDYLTMNRSSLAVYNEDGENITSQINFLFDQPYGNNILDFVILCDQMLDGEKLVIVYQVTIDDGAFIIDPNSSQAEIEDYVTKLTNEAAATSNETQDWVYDSVFVETYKAMAIKDGQYDEESNIVQWYIAVMPGEMGVTLKDVLGPNQNYIEGSLVIGEMTYGQDDEHLSDLQLTMDDLADGYTFAPDPTGLKIYTIYYQTKPTKQAIDEGEVGNSIYLDFNDNYASQWAGVVIGTPVLDKDFESIDESNSIISWSSTIYSGRDGLHNLIFKDTLGQGLSLIRDSIKINGELLNSYTSVGVIYHEYGFELSFGDVDPNVFFEITYDTLFDNSASATFENTATVEADNVNVSDTDDYDYIKKDNYITKYVHYNGSLNSEYDGIVSWEIAIDELPSGSESVIITDIIPQGMHYVSGSLKLTLNRNPYTTYELTPVINGNTITVDITSYIDKISGESGASLFLETQIDDPFGEVQQYINKAYISINEVRYPEVNASVTGKIQNLVDKSAIYTSDTAPDVYYTIKVNQGALDLDPNNDTLILDDQLGSALDFVMGSLKINGENWNDYDYDFENRTLMIKIPDNQDLIITYTARINLEVGDKLDQTNAYNEAYLSGFDEDSTKDQEVIIGNVLSSTASSTGDSKTIYIYKYRDGVINSPMEGVTFELYDCAFTGSGSTFTLTGEKTKVDTKTTGEDGYASFSDLSYDHVYQIVEVKTEDGYLLDTTERYFVYPGQDNITYPSSISTLDRTYTYYINNLYGLTNVNVSKVWNDNNSTSRPNHVVVYLKQNGQYVMDGGNKVSKVLNAQNNWQASFENLDKYDSSLNLYTYSVEEESITNYVASYQETTSENDHNFVITNTQVSGSLTISKTVGGNAGETDRDFTFQITLLDGNNQPLTDRYSYTGSKTGSIASSETVKLKHGESITITQLPVGTQYSVTEIEANQDGYVTTSTNTSNTIGNEIQTASFINSRDVIPTGNLTISKTVGGNDGETDRDFTFQITLLDGNNQPLTDFYPYTGSKTGSITSSGTVTLKHGESITITQLPVGTQYSVTEIEANQNGYITTSENTTGTIDASSKTASFVNTRNTITEYGSLTISKIVGGNAGETDRNFTFQITLLDENNQPLKESYPYTGSKTGSITSSGTVTLKHGESITITQLPVGTQYRVIEVEANQDGYVTTSENTTGTIDTTGKISKFINTKNIIPTGELTISKIVGGNAGETDRNFTFQITLLDENNQPLKESYSYTGSKTGMITSSGIVTLKHGESITITKLPVGTQYRVTEIEANQDGYITTSENENGLITEAIQNVKFINSKTELPVIEDGFLEIEKIVTGAGDKQQEFTFQIIFTDENGNVVQGSYYYTGSKNGTIRSYGTVTLKHGESITICHLPVNIHYQVIEIEANQDGYVTTSENSTGIISKEGNKSIFTNHLATTSTNTSSKEENQIYIPKTGIQDHSYLYLCGSLLSLLAMIGLRRKNG